MKGLLLALTVAALLSALPIRAQQILTLNDLLAKVEKNNPEILARQKQVASKEAMRKAAGSWEDPMVEVGLARHPTTYLAPGSSSILVEDNLYAKNIGISQKLPFFGTLHQKKKIAGQEKQEAQFGYQQTRLEKRSEAKKAYYEWARLQKDKELLERAYLVWEKLVSFTQTAYSLAERKHHEYLWAQVELVKVEAEKLENADALKKAAALLNYLAGENLSADTLVAESLSQEPEEKLPADSLVKLAVDNNPEIKILAASEQKTLFEKSLAAKGYYPDFEVGFYREQDINHTRTDRLINIYEGRFSFRLPLFFWTSRSREVQGKSLEAEGAASLRKNRENDVRAEVAVLLAEIERLAGQVRIYKEELLPRAQLLVEEGQTAYTVGQLSFPDYSEAQLEKIELERKFYGLLSDYWKSKAELKKTVGVD